jgi:NAD(P)-dependent dehydrogenase (short-subunit alcohol dehydrogenase family)
MKTLGATSTTDDVLHGIDLEGRRVLVTGVSAGLGAETARVLAAYGAEVVGAARNLGKAQVATRQISKTADGRFSLVELDLADLASVRACADELLTEARPFDLVIANAGVMELGSAPSRSWRTVDGFELHLGTNHLGHFVLVNRIARLMPPGARLVNLASNAHHFAEFDLEDPNFERRPYDAYLAYSASKTANILFTVEFDRRHVRREVRAAAVDPGVVMTEIARHMTLAEIDELATRTQGVKLSEAPIKTIAQGAATTVWAGIFAPADLVGGRYCEHCQVAGVASSGAGVRPYALDPDCARALWTKSEALVGEWFTA